MGEGGLGGGFWGGLGLRGVQAIVWAGTYGAGASHIFSFHLCP